MSSPAPVLRDTTRPAPPRGVAVVSRGTGLLRVLVLLACVFGARPADGAEPAPPALPVPAGAKADDAVPEYALKAAVLYNFARYTDWPSSAFHDEDDAKEPLVFAILGADPFGKYLDDLLDEKELGGRKVVLKHFANIEQLDRCHVLFVSRSVEKQLKDVLKIVKPWNTFTVAEFGDFARDGGIARLFVQSLQVRFEINVDAAERAKLKISSQLLKLSVVLKDD